MEKGQAEKFVFDLLRLMMGKKASDMFITAGFPPAMKIDGKLTPISQQQLLKKVANLLLKILEVIKIEMAEQGASFTYRLSREKLRKARRREGRYLLRTNLQRLSLQETVRVPPLIFCPDEDIP